MKEIKFIIIAGGTASGKTTVANQLFGEYKKAGNNVEMISLDNYYKTLDQLGVKHHSEVNWDDPSSFDWERLERDIDSLSNGESITLRNYNYGTGFYHGEEMVVEPVDVIFIEGIYALYNEKVRSKSGIKIYVEVESDIRLRRRIERDSTSRHAGSFDSEGFIKRWDEDIKPMHNKYISPTKEYADIIVRNDKQLDSIEKSSLIELLQSIMVK